MLEGLPQEVWLEEASLHRADVDVSGFTDGRESCSGVVELVQEEMVTVELAKGARVVVKLAVGSRVTVALTWETSVVV